MVQRAMAFSAQARGPEFRSQHPHKELVQRVKEPATHSHDLSSTPEICGRNGEPTPKSCSLTSTCAPPHHTCTLIINKII